MLNNFEFVNPELFWLLILLPVVGLWYFLKRNKQIPSLSVSSIQGFKTSKNWLARLRPLLFLLRLLTLAAIIVAMARPRTVSQTTRTVSNKGIDIVMAIDVSASMLARDLKPNRLKALKNVAAGFIKDRVTAVSYTHLTLPTNREV